MKKLTPRLEYELSCNDRMGVVVGIITLGIVLGFAPAVLGSVAITSVMALAHVRDFLWYLAGCGAYSLVVYALSCWWIYDLHRKTSGGP